MIKFGPAGNSDIFYENNKSRSSLEAPAWLKEMGLDAYEYSFSRGVVMKEETALALGKACSDNGVEISVHAPYYINLAGTDDVLLEKSFNYILDCLKYLRLLGGKRCVFHPGTCGKLDRQEAFGLLKERTKELVKRVREAGFTDMYVCPETMGKSQQLGTYQEIAELCSMDEILVPTIDFGHINALEQGSLKTVEDFDRVVSYLIEKLGIEKVKKMHVHFSKIEYGAKGEIKHLTFEDNMYGPEFENLAVVLKKYDLEPFIICESKGTQAIDAKNMKEIYKNTTI